MFRRIRWIVQIVLLLGVVAFFHYFLPQHDIVYIVGTDVIRTDPSGPDQTTRDVRYINAVRPDGRTSEYRNEDTGWGFPFYFKFDSGKLQAEAQALQSTANDPVWVVITHYGWRITYLSWYPNAVSIRRATGPDEFIVPWFNIFFLSGLALFAIWLGFRIWKFKADHIDPLIEEAVDEVDLRTGRVIDRAEGFWARLLRLIRRR